MCLDLAVAGVVIANLVIASFSSYSLHRLNSSRSRPLWKLVSSYGIVSTILVVSFYILYTPKPSLLGVAAGLFYLLIGSFSLVIEVPGYLLLRKHDSRLQDYLEDWRSELVKVRYEFQSFATLKSKASAERFQEVNLEKLVEDFTRQTERMQNIDQGLWTLVIDEVSRAIDQVKERSKHPAPELIDVLSLSGLSFIIAQILRVFG